MFVLPNCSMDFDVSLPQFVGKIEFLFHNDYDAKHASQ
jgi:hypothetical protein